MKRIQSPVEGKLTVAQAAQFIGVSEAAVRKWILEGRAPKYVKFMGRIYFDPNDVRVWFRNQVQKSVG